MIMNRTNIIEIKKDLFKGMNKIIGRKIKKSKISKTTFKRKGMNLDDIKTQFLLYLSRLTSNDTKDIVIMTIS